MAVVPLVVMRDPVDPEAIDVWLDGAVGDEACRFGLDTGAGTCRVLDTPATRWLPSSGRSAGVGASGSGLDEDEIELPVLRLGDVTVERVTATRAHPGVEAVPLVGMSALGRFRCRFRFAAGVLELSPPAGVPVADERPALVLHATGQPTVPVRFGALEVAACWDTGAGLTAVDTCFARAHPQLFEPVRAAVGVDASGVEMSSQIARMAACTIGEVDFPPTDCAIVDLGRLNAHLAERGVAPMTIVVGMPLIQEADWDLDLPAGRWAVEPR